MKIKIKREKTKLSKNMGQDLRFLHFDIVDENGEN